jgi:anti-anti-sigma factor
MSNFIQTVEGDIIIEKVNLTRATLKEAISFKEILQNDIEKKFKKIVIDISQCEFVDSTFLGALIFALREMNKAGGQLKIIQPSELFKAFLERTMVFESLKPFVSIEEAKASFNKEKEYVS